MFDFALQPPELISSRIYAGPGSAPLIAAAAAWDGLASQLGGYAQSYTTVVNELRDQAWAGPAAEAMAGAAVPFIAWANQTAAASEHTANQARAAAAAYETARATAVPPTAVLANRAKLAALIASNLIGQNTTAIAATEASYQDMWATDVAAMLGYTGSAQTATELTEFEQPPQTTTVLGQLAQLFGVGQASGNTGATNTQTLLSHVAAAVGSDPVHDAIGHVGDMNTLAGPLNFLGSNSRAATSAGSFITAVVKALSGSAPKVAKAAVPAAAAAAGGATASTAASSAGSASTGVLAREATVLAGAGTAHPIGGLSAPKAWADITPVAAAAEEPMWWSEAAAPLEGTAGEPAMLGAAPAGLAAAGAGGRNSVNSVLRVGPKRFAMPRPALGG